MKDYVWLFPVIFILHDMEEIVGFGIWLKNNKKLLSEKYPSVLNTYRSFSTEGFALAVFEELLLCVGVSAVALLSDVYALWCFWLGAFLACTLHFAVHIAQAIAIKRYIPATVTSVLLLPISVRILYCCFSAVHCAWWYAAIFVVAGIAIVVINLRFAQKLIGWFTVKTGLPPLV